jgi:hypothetical protein
MNTIAYKFNFKSRSIKDEAGNTIGRTKKQASVVANIPVPTKEDIIAILAAGDSAVSKLIADAIAGLVIDNARSQFDEVIEGFGDDSTKDVTVDVLDFDKLTLDYIASIPPTQRGTTAVTDEDWAQFYADYVTTMVAATGKEQDRIMKHVNIFKKPNASKTNKPVLNVLIDQLNVYMAASANIEDNALCASRLVDKFTKWYNEPDAVAVADML